MEDMKSLTSYMREIFLKSIPKLIENIKDELLSFTLVVLILISTFPDLRTLLFIVWLVSSAVYSTIKLKFLFIGEPTILNLFNRYLEHSGGWEKRFRGNKEYWAYKDDPLFQIEIGEDLVRGFKENWMKKYPDINNNYSFKVYLKYMNTVVHDCVFVALDGVRYIVPLPERKGKGYFYEKGSFKTKISEVIGQYSLYNDLEEFAKDHGMGIN